MKKFIRSPFLGKFFCTAAIAFISVACGSKTDPSAYLPEDASSVMVLDGKRISSKFIFDHLFGGKKEALPVSPEIQKWREAIENPEGSGLKLLDFSYIYTKPGTERLFAAVIKMGDEKVFADFLKTKMPEGHQVEMSKKDKYQLAVHKGKKFVVGFNESVAVAFFTEKGWENGGWEKEMEAVFETKNKENIKTGLMANKDFASLLKTPADMAVWTDMAKEKAPAPGLQTYWAHLKDNNHFVHTYFYFEKGYTRIKNQTVSDPAVKKPYAKLFAGKHDPADAKIIGPEPIAALCLSYDKELMHDLFADLQNFRAKMLMGLAGIEEKELLSMAEGDLTLALTDIRMIDTDYITYRFNPNDFTQEAVKETKTQPVFDFAANFSPGAGFQNLTAKLIKSGLFSLENGVIVSKEQNGHKLYIGKGENGKVVLGTSQGMFKNGIFVPTGEPKPEITKLTDGKPAAFYIDIAKLSAKMPETDAKNTDKTLVFARKWVQSLSFTLDEPTETGSGSELTVAFNNKDEISFFSWLRMAKEIDQAEILDAQQ